MKGQNVGYRRVSSIDQNLDRQLDGLELDKIFNDKISGAGRNRPGLDACLAYLREGDTLHVHSIDRLARNLVELQRIVEDLNGKGVAVRFQKEALLFDSNIKANAMNKLLFQVMGAFAEFERTLIRERQAEGIAKAKAQGRHCGRPRALTPAQENEAVRRRQAGETITALADYFEMSRTGLSRILADRLEPSANGRG
ncbi:MAG: recombinase family protein [Candidatus Moranbacteria bacterium]|nr:recombinase family protein [Candidatus Moranbacteria bacterium]